MGSKIEKPRKFSLGEALLRTYGAGTDYTAPGTASRIARNMGVSTQSIRKTWKKYLEPTHGPLDPPRHSGPQDRGITRNAMELHVSGALDLRSNPANVAKRIGCSKSYAMILGKVVHEYERAVSVRSSSALAPQEIR